MDIREFLSVRGAQAALSRATGLSKAFVYQIATGKKDLPIAYAATVEKVTDGAVTRKSLRPDDWHTIWPELVTRNEKN